MFVAEQDAMSNAVVTRIRAFKNHRAAYQSISLEIFSGTYRYVSNWKIKCVSLVKSVCVFSVLL